MTDTVTAKLAEWETLTEAATEGPWVADGTEITQHWSRPEPWLPIASDDVVCMAYCYGGSARGIESDADAEFIAHAREMVPALLGFVKDVLTLIDEDHCPGGCEHDAIDAEVLGDRIKRALMEQIGGHL